MPVEGYRDILYRKIKDSDALKFPMHEYAKKAASERAYSDLTKMMQNEINRRREKQNLSERDKASGAHSF